MSAADMLEKKHKVMIVDDEPMVARTTSALLSADLPDCEVFFVTSSADAIQRLRTPDISVLLCDLSMPGQNGIAVLKVAKEHNPRIVSLLVTGHATKEALLSAINDGGAWRCVEKPWKPADLVNMVRTAIEAYELSSGADDSHTDSRPTPAKRQMFIRKPEPTMDSSKRQIFIRKQELSSESDSGRKQVFIRKPGRAESSSDSESGRKQVFIKKPEKSQIRLQPKREQNHKHRSQDTAFLRKRYRDLVLIRDGGTSSVFKAHDSLLNIPVAIKLIASEVSQNQQTMATLFEEARLAMQLSHKHIVRLHNIEEENSNYFLVMEYIEGTTFRSLLKEHGRLPPHMIMQILDICEDALGYAHRRNVFHRDIKPENLMLTEDGLLKIIDFGIACIATESLQQRSEMCGTPYYISPEEARGLPLDQRTDLYSLGILIHEFLTGHLPDHSSDTQPETPYDYVPRASREVPEALRPVLDKSFAADREQRWRDIHEFAAAFREAYASAYGGPVPAAPPVQL